METIRIDWNKFNSITVDKYPEGYFIIPHTRRPINAPHGRVTNADLIRKIRESKLTYKLYKNRKFFTKEEVLDAMECLSKLTTK